jgi:PAS domain S-box-containing protein
MNPSVLQPLDPQRPSGRRVSAPLLVFGVCLLAGAAITWRAAELRFERARAAARAEARARLAALELGFSAALGAAEQIARSVREGNGRAPNFQRTATELLERHPALATIELQPGGVTTAVAPGTGYERLLGRNLMTDPLGREAALLSLRQRSATVTGPVLLADGLPGLLVRQPVFLGGPGGREQAWGLATVAARFRDLLLAARLEDLTAADYQFALSTVAAPLQPAATITSTFRAAPADALIEPVRLANLELRLAIRPRAGWRHTGTVAFHSLVTVLLAAAAAAAVHWRRTARAAAAAASEADLRAARDSDRFRSLFDAAPEAGVLVDRQGNIQRVNGAAERLFARRAAELGGQSINTLVPGLAALLAAASRSLAQSALQLTGVRAAAGEFPAEIRIAPLPSPEGGSPVCCWIRETVVAPTPPAPPVEPPPRPADQALPQALLDAIPHPVFLKDAHARFVTSNRAYQVTFGLPVESLRGKTVMELPDLPEETRRTFLAEDQAVIAEGGRRSYELPIVQADGSARTVVYAVEGYRLPNGEPGGLVGVLTDITAQKEAERELHRQMAELQRARFLSETVLELTGFASWRVPLDGSATFHSSPRAEALMGDPPQPAHRFRLVEDWFAHAQAADESAARAALEELQQVATGHRIGYEATYAYRRPADGRVVWLRTTGRVIKDDAGRPLEIFGVLSDVTATKRLEAELTAARNEARQTAVALAAALAAPRAAAPAPAADPPAPGPAVASAPPAAADTPDVISPPATAVANSPAVADAPTEAPVRDLEAPAADSLGGSESEPDITAETGNFPTATPDAEPQPNPATSPTSGPDQAASPERPSELPAAIEAPSLAALTEAAAVPETDRTAGAAPTRDTGRPASNDGSAAAPEAEIEPAPREHAPPPPSEAPIAVARPPKSARRRRVPREEQLPLFGAELTSSEAPQPPDKDPVLTSVPTDKTPPSGGPTTGKLPPAEPEPQPTSAADTPALDGAPAAGAESFAAEPVPVGQSATPQGQPATSASEPAAATEASEFAEIEGLDAADGLRRAGGERKAFLQSLRQFVEQYAHATDEIRDLLIQGDSVAAERVAGHLGRAAEEIGAVELARATGDLERAMREATDPARIETCWAAAERLLGELVLELKPRLKSRSERAAARDEPEVEFNPGEWRRVAGQMLPLLADADPGAADCLAANRDVLRSAFTNEAFAEFAARVTGSQFAEALEQLRKAAKRRGVNLL